MGLSALLLSAASLSACGGSSEPETSSEPAATPARPASDTPATPSSSTRTAAATPAEPEADELEMEEEEPELMDDDADMEMAEADMDEGDGEMQMASADGDLPPDHPALGGDATAGKRVFARCMSCHSVQQGQNKVGPSLYGIVGRPAGQVENFNYTEANAESGIVWTKDVLFEYLEDPQGYIPGTRMIFPGLPKEEDRRNVIAYLEEAGEQ
jgi:cytochrome c2